MRELLFSTISGITTVGGGLIALIIKNRSNKYISLMLGLASGVMTIVILLHLLPESLEFTNSIGVICGIVTGMLIMFGLDLTVTRLSKKRLSKSNEYVKLGVFVALGVAFHNLPEGLAIGAGYQATPELGAIITLAIALHNVPEGLGLAVPLYVGGVDWRLVLLICFLVGLFTPVGTLIGMLLFNINQLLIGISLAIAAGAMAYIVAIELLPKAWRQARISTATGFTIGILVALLI